MKTFYGYDAISITPVVVDESYDVYILPSMSQDKFDLLTSKFAYIHYLGSFRDGARMRFCLLDTTYDNKINFVEHYGGTSGDIGEPQRNRLMTEFTSFWSDPSMYERTYVGIGFGTRTVELVDKLTINSTDYTITEIKRNLVENEISIKAVEY